MLLSTCVALCESYSVRPNAILMQSAQSQT